MGNTSQRNTRTSPRGNVTNVPRCVLIIGFYVDTSISIIRRVVSSVANRNVTLWHHSESRYESIVKCTRKCMHVNLVVANHSPIPIIGSGTNESIYGWSRFDVNGPIVAIVQRHDQPSYGIFAFDISICHLHWNNRTSWTLWTIVIRVIIWRFLPSLWIRPITFFFLFK